MIKRVALGALVGAFMISTGAAQQTPPAADPAAASLGGPVLLVTDMARSVKFYTEGLGLVTKRTGALTALASAGKTPPPILMLQQAPTGPGAKPFQPGDGLVRFYLQSDDTAALMKRLQGMGYAPYIKPTELPGVIFVKDPDGYLYEITPPNAATARRAPPAAQ